MFADVALVTVEDHSFDETIDVSDVRWVALHPCVGLSLHPDLCSRHACVGRLLGCGWELGGKSEVVAWRSEWFERIA